MAGEGNCIAIVLLIRIGSSDLSRISFHGGYLPPSFTRMAAPERTVLPNDPFSRVRPSRPARRLVLALSRASMVALVIAVTAAASVISPIGTRRIARETVEAELTALLAPDELIVARAFASQRRPSDLWRLSHGLLVATNRRLLYVAAPPVTLLRPSDGGPAALYLETWAFDAAFTIALDTADGRFTLLTPARAVRLRIDDAERSAADSVRRLADRERRRFSEDAERLARTGVPTAQPDRYTTHIARRGETLTSIARRYDIPVDVLRQLNGLRDDYLRAGQRLRVPELAVARNPFSDSVY